MWCKNVTFLFWIYVFCLGNYTLAEKKALIIGISGQDGQYLAKLLWGKNYSVYGVCRSIDKFTAGNAIVAPEINVDDLTVYKLNIFNASELRNIIKQVMPDELYYLAAQSSPALSFKKPEETLNINFNSVLTVLEVIKELSEVKKIRIFLAASSEIIDKNDKKYTEDEQFALGATSPYGISKLGMYLLAKVYRETYGIYVCNGILFNHESPLRPASFLTRKITQGVAEISVGKRKYIEVGNLNAKRDYGYAEDYVDAMWLMLQQDQPDDYVLATGKLHSVRDIITFAFGCIGRSIIWRGEGLLEKGYDAETGDVLIKVNKKYFRPIDHPALRGNPQKACKQLNWYPRMSCQQMIQFMVNYDLAHINSR